MVDLASAKHAFITGGASGLGLGMADALLQRGVPVTIADIDAEALAAATGARGNSIRGQVLDVRHRDAWAKVKEEAEAAFGPVDILCCNAGISPNGLEFADMDPESYDRILSINLGGVANGIFAFAADFRARGRGHIVVTSSQAGLTTSVGGIGAYSVAKFGVTALGEQLRRELAPYEVGVSVLCPGYVPTELGANTVKLGGDIRKYSDYMPDVTIVAADVGAMVAEGIEQNSAYIITHKDVWGGVEKRMNGIKAACDYRLER
jgi:NAD(P)-dependent dehydrogenase (short-subunit alcohol dehydrogenase family)